jgi:hypothetical protein
MIEPCAALRAGAAALLDETGEPALARLVEGGEVTLASRAETWAMGARAVTAHHVALAIRAPAYAEIIAAPDRLDAVKRAFARAIRSSETELAELHLELLLPAVERSFHDAYRMAPPVMGPREAPSTEAILAGAAALLDARGAASAAALLRRSGGLEVSPVADAEPAILRCVVRLSPRDLVMAERDAPLGDAIRRAIQAAATRADAVAVAELALALALPSGA